MDTATISSDHPRRHKFMSLDRRRQPHWHTATNWIRVVFRGKLCVEQRGSRLTVVFEHPDCCSRQSGPQNERGVIELITQDQTALEVSRKQMTFLKLPFR